MNLRGFSLNVRVRDGEGFSGFTLIEVLVVIMIMAFFLNFGFSRYREFQRRQIVLAGARDVEAGLRLTASYASTGNKPAGCGSNPLLGHRFRVQANYSGTLDRYVIEAWCDDGTVQGLYVGMKNVDFSSEVDITPNNRRITFLVLQGGVNVVGPLPGWVRIRSVANTSVVTRVCIDGEGQIYLEDGNSC